MKRKFAFIAVIFLSSQAAFGANQTVAFGANDAASFIGTGPLLGSGLGSGTDVISFTGLPAAQYNFQLTLSGSYIQLSDIQINGVEGHIASNGQILFSDVLGSGLEPFQLSLTGEALNAHAGYAGQLAVSAVPELPSGFLLFAGMAFLAFVRRHGWRTREARDVR